jgi:hydroxyacyl-ACP dehydratase HTD2-like protein with hotdog domain
MMVFHATVRAVAYTIGELFELFDCPLEDGPMLGEMDLHQHRPLQVGETYAVQPTIVDVVRKEGRSGTFDLIATEFVVRGDDGEAAATLRNTYVCPRRA